MSTQPAIKWRNVWCRALKPADLDEHAPTPYKPAPDASDRAPGLYGAGFGGEVLVCLLPEDRGEWFVALACKDGKQCRHSVPL